MYSVYLVFENYKGFVDFLLRCKYEAINCISIGTYDNAPFGIDQQQTNKRIHGTIESISCKPLNWLPQREARQLRQPL